MIHCLDLIKRERKLFKLWLMLVFIGWRVLIIGIRSFLYMHLLKNLISHLYLLNAPLLKFIAFISGKTLIALLVHLFKIFHPWDISIHGLKNLDHLLKNLRKIIWLLIRMLRNFIGKEIYLVTHQKIIQHLRLRITLNIILNLREVIYYLLWNILNSL